MNADRELLELAAKAGRYPIQGWSLESERGMRWVDGNDNFVRYWNPLTDYNDAMHLAVELEMQVEYLEFTGNARARTRHGEWQVEYCMSKDFITKDPHAATRRAIVRAAAAFRSNPIIHKLELADCNSTCARASTCHEYPTCDTESHFVARSNLTTLIPLLEGRNTLKKDEYPYEKGNWRGTSWRLIDDDGDHVRFLDEFVSNFIESTIFQVNKQNQIECKQRLDRETARLGAIIEKHMDDETWLMEKLGISDHYKYRINCNINRTKIKGLLSNLTPIYTKDKK